MTIGIVQSVIDDLEGIGESLYADLGNFGHALAANIQYDAKCTFDAAVAAGKYTVTTFEAVGKDAIGNYWITVKAELAAYGAKLKDMILNGGGMKAALDYAVSLLHAIDWRDVAISLTGIGLTTLRASATAGLQMLISGVLAAA